MGLEVIDDLGPSVVLGDDATGLFEVGDVEHVDVLAVPGDGQEEVLAIVRDLGAGGVEGVLGVQVDENILGLGSSDLVVIPI